MAFKMELPLTESTPYVLIDEEAEYMRFKGESYSENTIEFFKKPTDWLTRYLATDFNSLVFDCELEYFNSSSSKLLYNMLKAMDKRASHGKKIVVNWYVESGNDIVMESGEDFKDELTNLVFNILEV